MITSEAQTHRNYFQVAWQSALAAGLCLGLPAGLVLWLILLRELTHSAIVDQVITRLQTHGLNSIFILVLCSLLWSFLLARISGYRPWWKIGLATVLGILVGWFSPLSNLDGWFADQLTIPALYTLAMCGIIGVVTTCVGLAYGFILRSIRAALTLALGTGIVSVLTLLLTITVFDQFGIRVGTGNFAMSKVTVAGLLTSAIIGGMVLGVGFTKFHRSRETRI